MKKILAVLLAVIMAFSLGVIGFAADEEAPAIQLTEFPTQREGAIFIASDNVYVEAGQTYDIPVYLVSDYTASVEGTVIAGFKVGLMGTGADHMKITAITPSADVQALANYELVGCGLDLLAEYGMPDFNQFSFTTTDMNILHQEKFHMATVTVEVDAEYVGSDDNGPVDCILDLLPAEHTMFFDSIYTYYALSPMAVLDTENMYEAEPIMADGINGPLFISAGHLVEKPYEPTWIERLKEWALNTLAIIMAEIANFFNNLNIVLPEIV